MIGEITSRRQCGANDISRENHRLYSGANLRRSNVDALYTEPGRVRVHRYLSAGEALFTEEMMIDCDMVQRDDMIDRYILHQLSPEEEDAFEEHYFACDRCFQEFQRARELIHILKEGTCEIRRRNKKRN